VAWCCGFYPDKSLNGASSRILNGPFRILELAPFSDLSG
jgi:hypothetical protein